MFDNNGFKLLVRQIAEEFDGGEMKRRVGPAGVEGDERPQDKVALVHPRMGQRQARAVHDHPPDGNQVDVDGAVDVGAAGRAVRGGVDGVLDGLQPAVQVERCKVGVEGDADVDEGAGAVEAPGLAVDGGGASQIGAERCDEGDRPVDDGQAVALVASYVYVGCQSDFLTSTSSNASMRSPSWMSL